MDYTKLYEILDDNNIGYERDENNRDVAIKIILELKKRKAKKYTILYLMFYLITIKGSG